MEAGSRLRASIGPHRRDERIQYALGARRFQGSKGVSPVTSFPKFLLPVVLVFLTGSALRAESPGPPYPTGLLPPTPEEKAWIEENARWVTFPEKELKDLPARVVNLEHLPPVRTQILGTCASWSVVYYLKGWQEAKEHGITRPFPEEHILSPAFVFQWVGGEDGSGSSIGANFSFLERHGTSTFEEFPETRFLMQGERPSVELWKSAARRRSVTGSMGQIPTSTMDGLNTLKALLAGGELASTAVGVFRNFDDYPAPGVGVDNGVFFAEAGGGFRGNHAVTIIGYDDNLTYHNGTEERQGAFLAVNSWGTNWGVPAEDGGERGYVWLAYEYFLNNRGAPAGYNFYTMENRIGYEPEHFAIVDLYHPRLAEINISLLTGSREDQSGTTILAGYGLRPFDARIAADITDLVSAEDEAFWMSVFDIVMPQFGPRPPAVIREVVVEQKGMPPLRASEKLPFEPVNQLEQLFPAGEWIPISPTRRHDEDFSSGAGQLVSADIADVFGEGMTDIIADGTLVRMQGALPSREGSVPGGYHIALGDYDNDGLPDLAVSGERDGVRGLWVYRNQGGGVFAEENVLFDSSDYFWPGQVFWADFTGNGLLDLVYMQGNGSRVLVNRGDGVFRDAGIELPRAPGRVNMLVDFDQDGLMDFGGWRNLGNGEWAPPPWPETAPIAWGDYNGNGLLDAAVSDGTTITIYRNEGGGVFTPAITDLAGPHSNGAVLRWGDVNNNGRLDLIAKGNLMAGFYVSTEAETMVYLQDEHGAFHRSGLAIHANGSGGILIAADFDRDGDLDFLTGGYPSVQGTSFSSSVRREVRYTEGLYAAADGRNRPNQPPSAPGNLRASAGGQPGAVVLTWDDAADDRTPPRGMRYQLRVGTSPGGHEVVSAGVSLADLPPRRISPEQAGQRLAGLSTGDYYWSVRAMDASGAFSPWAAERAFQVHEGVKPEPLFDPNRDGILDAADIVAVRAMIGSSSTEDLFRGDIDGTGSITENDALALARYLAGRPGALTPPFIAVVDHHGGELELDEAKVTIPPGSITGEPAIMRLQKMGNRTFASGNDWVTPYRLTGIPFDMEKPIEVSIRNARWWEENFQEPLIAVGEEGYSPSRGRFEMRYVAIEPDRYENYVLHFTIEPLPPETRKALRKDEEFVEGKYSNDFFVLGGYSHYTTPNFTIAFPRSYDTEVVENLANDLEQAHLRFRQPDMGFSYAARTRWPLSVTLKDLGSTTYGEAYSSRRGPNYGGMEFNTRLMGNATARRVTAFHEFFHIVEAFYDPRNRVRVATFMSPHYTLSEMAATWVEQFAVPNPATYVPSEWHAHRFELFSPVGLDLPPEIQTDLLTRDAGTVAAHGYGWSALIRWLANEHGNTVLRDIFTHVRSGQNWVRSIGLASGDASFLWFHRFMIAYTLGEVYTFTNEDRADVIGPDRLYISETNLYRSFIQPMHNLSAKLYGVNVSGPAMAAGFIKPEHRLGFRLEAPLGARLSIISQEEGQKPELEEVVQWTDDLMRHITDSVHPILSKPDSHYFALVTHDKGSPRHAEPEEFELAIALLKDETVVIEPFTSPGLPAYNTRFPPVASAGGTVFVPASGGISVTKPPGGDSLFGILTGKMWDDPGQDFEISLPITFTETTRVDGDLHLSVGPIERYELNLVERHGPDDIREVQTFTSQDGTFKVPGHYFEGQCEWNIRVYFSFTTSRIGGSQDPVTAPHWYPLLFFIAETL